MDIANAHCLNVQDLDRVLRGVQDQVLGQVLDLTESHILPKVRPDLGESIFVHYHLHTDVKKFMKVYVPVCKASQDPIPFHAALFLPFL
jgi:hypothetical protein